MRANPAVVAALGFDDGLGLGFGAREECTTPKQCARPALPQPAASRIRHLLATGLHACHLLQRSPSSPRSRVRPQPSRQPHSEASGLGVPAFARDGRVWSSVN